MPFFKALRIPTSAAAEKLQQQRQQQQQQPSNRLSALMDNKCGASAGEIIPNSESSAGSWTNSVLYRNRPQQQQQQQQQRNNNPSIGDGYHQEGMSARQDQQPQLAFYCQLAHGSTTGLISGFGSVRELYSKIAHCFDIRPDEILFCTLNTHKIDMSELVGGQIGLDDFIFAHKKGRAKEIELIKSEDALGLTLTDNGAGYVFIKRIKSNSIMDRLGVVQIGDHIEKLNELSLVGKRHYEVARILKQLERGSELMIRLVEPLSRTGFGIIGPRCTGGPRSRSKIFGAITGKETLRFRADGMAKIERITEDSDTRKQIDKINNALEVYMGISDNALARRLWEIAQNKINSMDLAKAIDSSMPDAFDFPEDFVFEVWKIAFGARNHH